MVRDYHDHPGYIAALAQSILDHWMANGRPDADSRLVMSFHGLPRRSLDLGDPYYCQCQKTGRLVAEALNLGPDRYVITFQSRFGRAQWLQPYTQPTLEQLARDGIRQADVICPGFAGDCLETLEEIALECRSAFLAAGGRDFRYIPCLNERADWISALADIALTHLGGWPDQVAADPGSALRARALGAKA
jgi:ferrochelatase